MKGFLKVLYGLIECLAVFIVGFYGVKYLFVAGEIFLGPVTGYITAGIFAVIFIIYILKKEGIIK